MTYSKKTIIIQCLPEHVDYCLNHFGFRNNEYYITDKGHYCQITSKPTSAYIPSSYTVNTIQIPCIYYTDSIVNHMLILDSNNKLAVCSKMKSLNILVDWQQQQERYNHLKLLALTG